MVYYTHIYVYYMLLRVVAVTDGTCLSGLSGWRFPPSKKHPLQVTEQVTSGPAAFHPIPMALTTLLACN